MGHLVGAAGTLDHGSLGRASIHNKGAAESRTGIGCSEADKIGVLVEFLMVAGGVGARGGCALRSDHEQTGAGDGNKRLYVSPAQVMQP